MSTSTLNNHYIPQSHLRQFILPGHEKANLVRIEGNKVIKVTPNTRNVGSERGLYPWHIEKKLGYLIDSRYPAMVDSLKDRLGSNYCLHIEPMLDYNLRFFLRCYLEVLLNRHYIAMRKMGLVDIELNHSVSFLMLPEHILEIYLKQLEKNTVGDPKYLFTFLVTTQDFPLPLCLDYPSVSLDKNHLVRGVPLTSNMLCVYYPAETRPSWIQQPRRVLDYYLDAVKNIRSHLPTRSYWLSSSLSGTSLDWYIKTYC